MGSKVERVAAGLMVVSKYSGAAMCATRDTIKAGAIADMSPEDEERMTLLGWHRDGEQDGGWEIFV